MSCKGKSHGKVLHLIQENETNRGREGARERERELWREEGGERERERDFASFMS